MNATRYSVEQGVAVLELNRPERRNALNEAMRDELRDTVTRLRSDRDVHALVLAGAGGAFCAGGDLKGISSAGLDNEGWRNRMADLHSWLKDLLLLDRPVIAAVDGPAYGAGFSLALAADFIVATPRARFCMSFMRVGAVPDLGAFYTLPRIVGPRRARELMLSTREIDAEEALALGIVSEIVPVAQLRDRALALAASFEGASPLAVSLIKRAVTASSTSDLSTMLDIEAVSQSLVFGGAYHHEAIARFLNKQPAMFRWPE
ncbi:enoyl-CoA hydratase/isomerase family protein [Alcanivorax sp. JB21]|uniref:enoyl-CoA hydratase/isomerase family protein n=1 Tax=Alcanivorax limicola TaxID=2874102 RepID=UPI001CC00297|nr:enoyl-CoA hydratase/isomerase family protein [Alcanivorax limicola]MBZ2187549.1 enoyl-CoA hydratase/isomerase family protein [Alcanivorax limicola]